MQTDIKLDYDLLLACFIFWCSFTFKHWFEFLLAFSALTIISRIEALDLIGQSVCG